MILIFLLFEFSLVFFNSQHLAFGYCNKQKKKEELIKIKTKAKKIRIRNAQDFVFLIFIIKILLFLYDKKTPTAVLN